MGNCAGSSSPDAHLRNLAKKQNDALEHRLQNEFNKEKAVVKILLLGTGNSGKSTILKQFKILHSKQGLGDANMHRNTISLNIVRGILVLAQGSKDLQEVAGSLSEESKAIVEKLKESSGRSLWELIEFKDEKVSVGELVKRLWEDPVVPEALKHESKLSMLETPMDYYMDNIDRILSDDYVPNKDDILHARARTIGVVSIEFSVDSVLCRMLDVGGQKNERKKWISHFDDVTTIMFLVSLAEYDKNLLEDSSVNRMNDALAVFEDIVVCPYFEETNIILFLNKKDLFEEKIKTTNLTACFPEYDGPQEYEPALQFIQDKFVNVFRRVKEEQGIDQVLSDIFPYPTVATNTENVATVFALSKHCVFKNSLSKLGMI